MILKKLFGTTVLSLLLYFQLSLWQLPILGWFFLLIYFLFTHKGFYLFLVKLFGFSANIYTKILGAFINFFILGFLFSIALLFNNFQNEIIALAVLINGLISVGLEKYLTNHKNNKFNTKKLIYLPKIKFPFFKFVSLVYIVLITVGFYLLYISKTDTNILSPWHTISSSYIYVFFSTTLLLGFLIFTKLKIKTLLLFLILHSLMLHAYLPLTHDYFYGGDQWRHTATEERLVKGLDIIPGTKKESTDLASTFTIGKLSYSNFWGLNSFLSKVLQIDLITLNIWLLPILFSLILPILLFELGCAFKWGRKESLFFVFVSSLPFSLQALGSMTLPVSFGFLPFILSLILLIKYLKSGKKEQLASLIILGFLFLFGYVLYFILLWLGLLAIILLKNFHKKKVTMLIAIVIAIVIAIFIPTIIIGLEILSGHSIYRVFASENSIDAIKQVVGNFSGWYVATGPREHAILTGNFLFNQIPSYAFVKNIFTSHLYLIPVFTLFFWAITITGVIKSFTIKNLQLIFISSLSIGLTISYIISRYFLSGENILTRRLDMTLGLLCIILFCYGLFNLLKKYTTYSSQILIFIILIMSIAITMSYSLGPNIETLSKNEYQSMEFVWKNEKNNKNHCIFANTYPLLSLEAISKKEIIGGGLPIDKYFSQTELTQLYRDILISNKTEKILEDINKICKSNNFWVLSDNNFKPNKFGTGKILKWNKFENLFIWQIELK